MRTTHSLTMTSSSRTSSVRGPRMAALVSADPAPGRSPAAMPAPLVAATANSREICELASDQKLERSYTRQFSSATAASARPRFSFSSTRRSSLRRASLQPSASDSCMRQSGGSTRVLRTLSEEPAPSPRVSGWPEAPDPAPGRRRGRASYAGLASRPEVLVPREPLSLPPDPDILRRQVTAKVMLLGDAGVGKTCMLIKFKDGHFLSGTYITTVGIDYRNKVVDVDGSRVKLQVWDTAGQERFRSVTHAYYRDAHALLLLYDVTSKTSFENTRAWLAEIREYAQDDVVIMLLGNKCDRAEERAIPTEVGERLAREFNVVFMETSAKTGMNVDLAFTAIARDLLHRQLHPNDSTFNVQKYVEERSLHASSCPCGS